MIPGLWILVRMVNGGSGSYGYKNTIDIFYSASSFFAICSIKPIDVSMLRLA